MTSKFSRKENQDANSRKALFKTPKSHAHISYNNASHQISEDKIFVNVMRHFEIRKIRKKMNIIETEA